MKINDKKNVNKQKILLAGLLISIGVLSRIILHDFFNNITNPWEQSGLLGLDVFFVIATVSIFSGIVLGKHYLFIIPISVIVISDVFYAFVDPINVLLYTTYLFLFTITGYIFISLIGFYTKKKSKLNKAFIPKIFGAGIVGIVIYDLWTNFGFWLSFSRLYPNYLSPTFSGLIQAYTWGIPMMIWHILSGLITITIFAVPLILLKEHKIFQTDYTLKPLEKYSIASATIVLMILSIITALF